jgi:hypothetical protein
MPPPVNRNISIPTPDDEYKSAYSMIVSSYIPDFGSDDEIYQHSEVLYNKILLEKRCDEIIKDSELYKLNAIYFYLDFYAKDIENTIYEKKACEDYLIYLLNKYPDGLDKDLLEKYGYRKN